MPDHALLFCLAAAALIVTPGPNFLYILTRAVTEGRRTALVATVGLGCGVLLHTLLAVIGLSALVRSSYFAFRLVKYGGSIYLVLLGLRALRDRRALDEQANVVRAGRPVDVLGQSVVASLSNPKTIVFFIAFLPQFVDTNAGHVASQLLALGVLYMLLTIAVYGLVAMIAGRIGHALHQRPAIAKRLRWMTGGSFIALGTWAAISDTR